MVFHRFPFERFPLPTIGDCDLDNESNEMNTTTTMFSRSEGGNFGLPSSSAAWLHDITASARWRKADQLRGLQANHSSLAMSRAPLAKPGTVLTAASLSLHNTELSAAVVTNPLCRSGSIGLLPLVSPTCDNRTVMSASIDYSATMRWLDAPDDCTTDSVAWVDDLVVVGSSRGRVLVGEYTDESCREGSGSFTPSGCLFVEEGMKGVGSMVMSPSGPSASTTIRSLCTPTDASAMLVGGVQAGRCVVWDLNGSSLPVWSFNLAAAERTHVQGTSARGEDQSLLFADPLQAMCWAPGSNHVVAMGSLHGLLALADSRLDRSLTLSFSMPKGFMVRSVAFNTVMPWTFAACSSDGSISIFDNRFGASDVLKLQSGQGDCSSMCWLPTHADLFATGGSDGSIKLWSLRASPTYCVGKSQFRSAVSDVRATSKFVQTRVIGLTVDGELVSTSLSDGAMKQLAPPPSMIERATASGRAGAVSRRGGRTSWSSDSAERAALGALYARSLKEAYNRIADCVQANVAHKYHDRALELIELTDPFEVTPFDYDSWSPEKPVSPRHPHATALFFKDVNVLSCRLPSTVAVSELRGYQEPDAATTRRLEALRRNISVQRSLDVGDIDTAVTLVRQQIAAVKESPSAVELISHDTLCAVFAHLLKNKPAVGCEVVKAALDALILPDSTTPSKVLLRHIITTSLSPFVTADLVNGKEVQGGDSSKPAAQRKAKHFLDRALRDLSALKESVCIQLDVVYLYGVTCPNDILRSVTEYQQRCLEHDQPGVFQWLSLRALLLYLHSLAENKKRFVGFLWVAVQLIETFAAFPQVKEFEGMLFSNLDRMRSNASNLKAELDEVIEAKEITLGMVKSKEPAIMKAHVFLEFLIRLQLECENVLLDSELDATPQLMAHVEEVLNNMSSELLESWDGALGAFADSIGPVKAAVKAGLLPSVKNFTAVIEAMMHDGTAADGEDDETLANVIQSCDAFVEAMMKR